MLARSLPPDLANMNCSWVTHINNLSCSRLISIWVAFRRNEGFCTSASRTARNYTYQTRVWQTASKPLGMPGVYGEYLNTEQNVAAEFRVQNRASHMLSGSRGGTATFALSMLKTCANLRHTMPPSCVVDSSGMETSMLAPILCVAGLQTLMLGRSTALEGHNEWMRQTMASNSR
jgi:hypothetical protein